MYGEKLKILGLCEDQWLAYKCLVWGGCLVNEENNWVERVIFCNFFLFFFLVYSGWISIMFGNMISKTKPQNPCHVETWASPVLLSLHISDKNYKKFLHYIRRSSSSSTVRIIKHKWLPQLWAHWLSSPLDSQLRNQQWEDFPHLLRRLPSSGLWPVVARRSRPTSLLVST